MNTHAAILSELALTHERAITRSNARRAWHLELLRQSRAGTRPRTSPWWRNVRDRMGGWVPFRHRPPVESVARQSGRPGPISRLARALHHFLNPRGFALRQYRQAELARGAPGATTFTSASQSAAQVETFPAPAVANDPAMRDAA